MVGITGTNGKTSCSHWYAQAMASLGRKTAVLGTLGSGWQRSRLRRKYHARSTVLQRSLAYIAQGAQVAVRKFPRMVWCKGESMAPFLMAVLSNLSRDHLDYHKDMNAYAAARRACFFGRA